MIVVKVGGSLYDSPGLGPALRAFVESLVPAEVLLVPGGGAAADAVRELDRTHALGEEAAHWLALRALSVTAAFLRALGGPLPPPPSPGTRGGVEPIAGTQAEGEPPAVLGSSLPMRWAGKGTRVLDCFAFALEDESRPGALPHTWSVTTDSIAARAAVVFRAERLVLLKSVDVPPGAPWEQVAANGWVDEHFPRIAKTLPCPIDVVNFRSKFGAPA